jgi:hypothetical protein
LITAAALFVTITIRSTSLNHLTGAHFCLHTSVRLGCPSDTEWKVVASKSARRKEAKERMATDVRNGEKRGKDYGPNTAGEAAANAATPGKDDGTTQTEQRRSCNENRTDVGIEDGHAPSHTATVCGDPYAQRGSKNDICRNNSHGQTEHPPHGDWR